MDEEISWLEVKVVCSGEIAESVSDILSRYVTQGVVTETDAKYDEAEEVLLETGEIRVFGYLINDETVEETRKKIEQALWHLNMIQPVPQPTYRTIENENWMESWKEYYRPILVGEKLLILPPWMENPFPERTAVKVDPSMAFGTGTHPSTQLCMDMMEDVVERSTKVIDIGCGSGILSITAILLGAEKALGVDLDYASVVATRSNAKLNGVDAQIVVGKGSLNEILNRDYEIYESELVVINILAPIILRFFSNHLDQIVKKDGHLILSGILDHQTEEIIQQAEEKGFILIQKKMIQDWVGLHFKKN